MSASFPDSSANKFRFRMATESDVHLLFLWANDESVRYNALRSEFIDWNTHLNWFSSRIKNLSCLIHIFYAEEMPIGQVRIDEDNGLWHIDYSVDALYRGIGYGKKMIREIIKEYPNFIFAADVKVTNVSSVKVFEALGFKRIAATESIYKFKYPF